MSLALAGFVGLSGCGGGKSGQAPPAQSGAFGGVPLRLADCTDWSKSSVRGRKEAIEEMKNFAGGPNGTGDTHGATLPYDKAYELLSNYCKRDFARGFKLYKLYVRAAAFSQQ